jgi:predicted kinase
VLVLRASVCSVATAPTLLIVSGLPGSGKTRLALKLAHERPGVRLCPDEWMAARGADIWDSDFRERVEQFQQTLVADLLRCGTTAIIEWGTWAREERERLRQVAQGHGAGTELIVLDPPLEALWRRLVERGQEDPPMRREDLEGAFEFFQRPDDEEASMYDMFTYLDH